MNGTSARYASFGAASLLAAALLAAPAFADGLPSKGKTRGPHEVETRPCAISGNVGLTTDYVFRGISQSGEEPAVQGALDFTCGRFYFGVFGSSVDFGGDANAEIDIYGGIKHTTGPITWDLGLIYYAYSGRLVDEIDANFLELKVGASASLWKGGTVSGTVFYSPEYTFNTGETFTFEAGVAHVFPQVGPFTPTVSALYGYTDFQDKFQGQDLSYGYWNAGVTLGFLEKWSLDLRYWDSENEGFAAGAFGEERFVATVKYSF